MDELNRDFEFAKVCQTTSPPRTQSERVDLTLNSMGPTLERVIDGVALILAVVVVSAAYWVTTFLR
jgi:hypothetical protein